MLGRDVDDAEENEALFAMSSLSEPGRLCLLGLIASVVASSVAAVSSQLAASKLKMLSSVIPSSEECQERDEDIRFLSKSFLSGSGAFGSTVF